MALAFSHLPCMVPQLGAVPMADGTHFSVFSAHAEKIELCIFSADGQEELTRLALPQQEGHIFSGYVPGIVAGTIYGYRAHGPYAPEQGHRFNPNKLLLDPYARNTLGNIIWDDALYGYHIGAGNSDLSFDTRDSAPFMAKGIVEDAHDYDWEGDRPLRRHWHDSIIYEAHVRGMTMLHPDVPENMRGTFRAMANPAILNYLKDLGITAVELLPIHSFVDDRYLLEKGLRNYWGYQTLNFFAPHQRYLFGRTLNDFRDMVKAYHAAGLEVIMDVVYNHTAEGSERGPTLSYRGLDNASYYHAVADNKRYVTNETGTGNSLNVQNPMVMRMVLDSLRYWAEDMHVDGFRFDLASTLGREDSGFNRDGGFFDSIRQDPTLSGVKLIAEPWDIGPGGYQVGGFPYPFREWNDKFRDTLRGFWRGDAGKVGALANHFTGSAQQFNHDNRPATSSINMITAHDGFTLRDVVSYNDRHNEANGEDNRDGSNNNMSGNMGAEGPTTDAVINKFRQQRQRNLLASLFTAHGVPMLLSGDEIGNSQNGNNNVYAQDNETSWVKWHEADKALHAFVKSIIALRKAHPALTPDAFAHGGECLPGTVQIIWYRPDGLEMDQALWNQAELRVLSLHLQFKPHAHDTRGPDELYITLNAGDHCEVKLPDGKAWVRRVDTSKSTSSTDEAEHDLTEQGMAEQGMAEQGMAKISPASLVMFTPQATEKNHK